MVPDLASSKNLILKHYLFKIITSSFYLNSVLLGVLGTFPGSEKIHTWTLKICMQNFNLKMCLKMHTSCKTNVVLDPKLNVNLDPDSKVVLVPHHWLQTR